MDDTIHFSKLGCTSNLLPIDSTRQGHCYVTIPDDEGCSSDSDDEPDISREEAIALIHEMMNGEFACVFDDISAGANVEPIVLKKRMKI